MSEIKNVDVWELPKEAKKEYQIEVTDDGLTFYGVTGVYRTKEDAHAAGMEWSQKLGYRTFRIVEK